MVTPYSYMPQSLHSMVEGERRDLESSTQKVGNLCLLVPTFFADRTRQQYPNGTNNTSCHCFFAGIDKM